MIHHAEARRLPANTYEGLGHLTGAIITDCGDDNAKSRQELSFQNLFGIQPTFLAVDGEQADFEAGANLVDLLVAREPVGNYPSSPLVTLVNVAPRDRQSSSRRRNGSPFGHVKVGNAHVFSTTEGRSLSLLKKLGIADSLDVYDIPRVTEHLVRAGNLSGQEARELNETQFRSLETLQKIAYEVVTGNALPTHRAAISPKPDLSGRAFTIDNFGNIKIAATPREVGYGGNRSVEVVGIGAVRCVAHLADVPEDKEFALTIGSSGQRRNRFLELVIKGGKAVEVLSERLDQEVRVGDQIIPASAVA